MHKTYPAHLFARMLLIGILLTFPTYPLFPAQADEASWAKESRVMDRLCKSLGLKLHAPEKPINTEDYRFPHDFGAYGDSVEVMLNQSSNMESLQKRLDKISSERDRKFWVKGTLKGMPSMSYMGQVEQTQNGAKVIADRSIIRLLIYPYLLEV